MSITALHPRHLHVAPQPTGRRYHLVSADSHVNEPGDLWTSRVAAAYRDRVPRIERFEQGDAFVMDGVADPMPFGLNASVGKLQHERKAWMFWDQVRAGGYDPAERVKEMDLDQVDGEVLFPSPRLFSALFAHPVWEAVAERDLTLNIHVALSPGMPKAVGTPGPLPGAGRHLAIAGRLLELVFSGIFDRFPSLQLVAAEVDCGCVPYYKEQIDDNFRRFRHNYTMERSPSDYLETNVNFSFVTDSYGVDNRHRIGVDRILWSTDYPHPSSSWPNSGAGVNSLMSGVPAAERDLILFGNAVRLCRFDR